MFVSSIIVAGGSGKRFGGKKQFFNLCGKPVVLWSIEKFLKLTDEVILVLPKEDINSFRAKWVKKYPALKICAGGKERFISVENGLKNISAQSSIVCIHDGARPLTGKADILRCIKTARKHGAAICAAPASDTIKLTDGKTTIEKTLDRRKIFLAQTPQVFRKEVILKAFKNKAGVITDDAQMVERTGLKVRVVPVTTPNTKITEQSDILIAEKLIRKYKT
ncbi:MAG: 2-C-methyl-D-erythritol 4-phosphate cytidylyltransferase [Elusimicrobia bacterium RIFOXYA2_FULL_39_19]|nr:MAG: 2-C-methyl-D-erythritol 4-phosphate cytidylyltransferase [Elusimicrobia bacterium RIFOXYA2_FULL_39_19]